MKLSEAFSALRLNKERKFLLQGSEKFLKQSFVKSAKDLFPEYAVEDFSPENQREAFYTMDSEGFFEGDRRIIVLNDFDAMGVESFIEYFQECSGIVIAVLTETANIKTKAMTKIISTAAVVECNKFKEYGPEFPNWIKFVIKNRGFEADGVETKILELVGPNMFRISHELDKLFLVKIEAKKITMEDVQRYVAVSSMASVFEIFENLISRDIKSALSGLQGFIKTQESYFGLIAFLGSYFEKMYKMLLLKEQKMETDAIADIIGIPAYFVKSKYMSKALNFGKSEIAKKIDQLCNLNNQLIDFRGDKKFLIEKFFLSFQK